MLVLIAVCALAVQALPFTGTNLAGGDFGNPQPGKTMVYGKDFVYPSAEEFRIFTVKGMNVVRIGFHWEVVQPELMKELDPVELQRLASVVRSAEGYGLTVLLDPHNYARYYNQVIGSPAVPNAAFADFWRRLAEEFKGDRRVWFGLVNEPHDLPAAQWVSAANAAIRAIRTAGAKNLILVPGVCWTGAWTWDATWYGEPNSRAMDAIVDPGHHYAIEVHQYLDTDGSGTHVPVVTRTVGSERLAHFVAWCRTRKLKAFLGEFAAGNTPDGRAAIEDMLQAMEHDRDV